MDLSDLLNHLLNFLAPALSVALLVTLVARLFLRKRPAVPAAWAQTAINFAASAAALAFGLWFFGRDGKMLTYTGMALACATSQWCLLRGWR